MAVSFLVYDVVMQSSTMNMHFCQTMCHSQWYTASLLCADTLTTGWLDLMAWFPLTGNLVNYTANTGIAISNSFSITEQFEILLLTAGHLQDPGFQLLHVKVIRSCSCHDWFSHWTCMMLTSMSPLSMETRVLLEVCSHGTGIPDPALWVISNWSTHGCSWDAYACLPVISYGQRC